MDSLHQERLVLLLQDESLNISEIVDEMEFFVSFLDKGKDQFEQQQSSGGTPVFGGI